MNLNKLNFDFEKNRYVATFMSTLINQINKINEKI
jgi:hypothetical protein